MKKLFCCILFCTNISFSFAESMESANERNELKYILSLDTSYTMTAVQYSGFGYGISYEHKITRFFSAKLVFGQMFLFFDTTILTIDQQLFLYYYPLNNGLDKLYIGLGHGGNLFIYPNYIHDDGSIDATISITPILGWKWKILGYLMVDPFIL